VVSVTLFPYCSYNISGALAGNRRDQSWHFLPSWLSGLWPNSWRHNPAKAPLDTVWMAREASHGVWGLRPIHTAATWLETSGTREIWSSAHLEQVGPGSIRIAPSIMGWKKTWLPSGSKKISTSTTKFGFSVFGYSGGSCETFQTRSVGLDECVLCNWEHV
jgi:hypothetical protein